MSSDIRYQLSADGLRVQFFDRAGVFAGCRVDRRFEALQERLQDLESRETKGSKDGEMIQAILDYVSNV